MLDWRPKRNSYSFTVTLGKMNRNTDRTISMGMILFTLFFANTLAFNLEPNLAIVKKGDQIGSYFGYSVSPHIVLNEGDRGKPGEPVLLIGAPRAQNLQPETNHSGAVYRCPLTPLFKDCRQLPVDPDSSLPPENDVIKDHQWLGVSVKSQGRGGFVATCAHRYVVKEGSNRWGSGICYVLRQTLDYKKTLGACENRATDKGHEQFGYCQSGTSVDISEGNEIMIGTPGPYTWRGTVFVINLAPGLDQDSSWYSGPVLDSESPVEKYSYLGMSVTSGSYYHNGTVFVGGAPRANGTGQVVFLMKQKGGQNIFSVHLVLGGEQIASSFGYSLASLDANNDGLPDLVVGAPFFYSRNEGGAVYIYMNTYDGFITETTTPLKLTGKPESRFGFALANASDINKDGYEDLAIGAPYYDDKGAVFIHLGSANGVMKEPSQVIFGKKVESIVGTRISTFGYSLGGGLDMDGNDYPDLLVGAYDSDTAVLLRSRPIIDITTSVEGELSGIDPDKKGCEADRNAPMVCFVVKACFQSSSSVDLYLSYRIEAETFIKKYYRVKFNSSFATDTPNIVEKRIQVRRKGQVCSSELVYLKDKSDIQSPIKFQLTYKLIQKEPEFSNKRLADPRLYPILNQQEAKRIFEAKFLKNCGDNEICESDLKVMTPKLNLPIQNGVYVLSLGETKVNMTILIRNMREPAYDANLYIDHSPKLDYIGGSIVKAGTTTSAPCMPKENNAPPLVCNLGNPFQGEVELSVRFNPKDVPDEEETLSFEVTTNTTSQEEVPEDNSASLTINVIRIAQLELKGVPEPEQVFYGGEIVGENVIRYEDEIGSPVIHKYAVQNHGPWKVRELQVIIEWPYQVENGRDQGKWLLYLMENPLVKGNGFCEMPPGSVNERNIMRKADEKPPVRESNATLRSVRRKREIGPKAEEVRLEGKTHTVVTMDCRQGTAKCFRFVCNLYDLDKGNAALIQIRARLWNSTFVEDYPSVDWVRIISRGEIKVGKTIQQITDDDYAMVETKAYPDIPLYQKPKDVPLWIIILSACGGILVLLIVVIILWRLGFFKRKKPGYELAPMDDKEKNHAY